MPLVLETERLLLRELRAADAQSLSAVDSDLIAPRYLGNNPVVSLMQSQEQITLVQQQYHEHGIGRWAVIDKPTGDFGGWSGLKLITENITERSNFCDLGYRFLRQYWGRGYATESARAGLHYGFDALGLTAVNGMADGRN